MTTRNIDEQNQIVVVPSEATSATLTSSFNVVGRSMVSDSEFLKYADEAIDEYRKGIIHPIQSSAELL